MARVSHVSVTLSLLLLAHCPGDPATSPDAVAQPDASTPVSDAKGDADAGPAQDAVDVVADVSMEVGDALPADAQPRTDVTTSPDAQPQDADAEVTTVQVPACGATPTSLVTPATIQAPDSGSDGWAAPSEATLAGLEDAVATWFSGDKGAALTQASAADYTVCADGSVSLWRPAAGSGRAWLLLRQGEARPVTLATPHPWFEFLVLDQTLGLFDALGARAAVVAGTHRCASPEAGSCSGSSSVCTGASAPFRISDQAHAVDGTFQAVHRALLEAFPDDVYVSIHGMGATGASVSNGRTGAAPAGDIALALSAALSSELAGEYVTSCSTNAAVPHDARLCGTTNAQGRLVNGSAEPCGTAPSSATGRFVHLEQSLDVRGQPAAVQAAFEAALPP